VDYTTVDIDTQFEHITSELPNVELLSQKATMWTQAGSALTTAESNFNAETKKLAPDFRDRVGDAWLERAEADQRTLSEWAQNVTRNNPSGDLTGVSQGITQTHQQVSKFKEIADALKPLLSVPAIGAMVQQMLLQLQQASGTVMNKLVADYSAAGSKVAAAGSGGPWDGVNGSIGEGGAQEATFSPTGELLDPGSVDSQGMAGSGADAMGGGEAGQESGVDSGQESGPASTSPELSGGGGLAPGTVAPTAPSVAPAPAAGPSGMPMSPAFMGAGARAVGGNSGGGVRMPSVNVARTGPASIPAAAAPVSSLTGPAPAGSPPAAPQPLATPAASTSTGVSGVPPFVPPMAGAGIGAGGSGTVLGAGGSRRPFRRTEEDEDTPTPGLPVLLSGKAGMADPYAFAARQHSDAPDAPSTVQFIDEEL
jgi:hypothetical protein